MTTVPAAAGASFLDDHPLSGLQVRTLLLCGLVGVLDGNDTGAMGIGAPAIAATLHVAPSAMGWAISGSWVGAAAGAILLGALADRLGRKSVLTAAVLIFGVFTLLTPLAGSLPELVTYRVLAGIGLGGATPCFIALASEYSPKRIRASLVSLVWAAFPLGLLVGGLLNGLILTRLTWQWLFYVGGAVPLVTAVLLMLFLPESIGLLLARGDSRAARIVEAIAPGVSIFAAAANPAPAIAGGRPGVADLMRGGRLRATLCLWVLLFAAFGTTASMSWVPTILQKNGVSLGAAAVAVSFLGLGALIGMAIAGQLVDRFGPVRALVGPTLAGALATAGMGLWPASPQAASVFVTLVGALVGLGASGGIALIASVYPTVMRSTGAGWAMGMGRFGQVIVPAGFAVLLQQGWSAEATFLALGLVPLVAAGAALLLRDADTQAEEFAGAILRKRVAP